MSNYDAHGASNKPDSNCRTCTDFKYWSKQQRQVFHKAANEKNVTTTSGDGNSKNISTAATDRDDCPLDKGQLGRATWGLLHTIAAFYPENPSDNQKTDAKTFLDILSRIYPCEFCAADFRKDMSSNPPAINNQTDFAKWMCDFHNRVNVKLGKPMFDCSKVNERWRDGWLDGSCD